MVAYSKAEVWKAVHEERVACPVCGRSMTRRTLRWKHLCRRPALLPEQKAAARVEELERLAIEALNRRLAIPRHEELSQG